MNLKSNEVLILRTCNADMTAYNGFKWPKRGRVKALDWNPDPAIDCGRGLHGALWGEGRGSLFNWSSHAKWLVVKANKDDVVPSSGGGKVRFGGGTVVHCGDQKSATDYIRAHGAIGAVIGAHATAGDRGTATAGYHGAATAGYYGVIQIAYWDGSRRRIKTGYIGGDRLKPNVAYKLNNKHEFEPTGKEVANE